MIRIFFLVLLLLPALPAAAANCWLPMDPLPPDYCRDRTTFVETAPNDTDPLDGAIRRVLQSCKEQNPATATLRKAAFAEGMRTLRLSGAQKVGSGLTTIAEVLRVSPISQEI